MSLRMELVKANVMYGGMSISEDACKDVVVQFKEPVPVTLVGTSLIMGKIISVEYNEETKILYGEVELEVAVVAGIEGTQAIDLPDGKRMLAGILRRGLLYPSSLTSGGKNEVVK